MRKRASFLDFGKLSRVVFLALLFFCCSTSAQAQLDSPYPIPDTRGSSRIDPPTAGFDRNPALLGRASSIEDGKLFSSSVSQKFYEIAYELTSANLVEPAIVFLTAAMKLDNNASDARSLLIKLACKEPEKDHSNLVYNLLMDYVDESADIEVAKKAVTYLLGQLNTREQRENFLEQMMETLGDKNAVFGSELSTLLGLLKAEKTDLEAAEFYLMQAYKKNRYNKLAFAKLAELKPERIGPAIYLERLRLALRENPSDIEAALTFAQHVERLQLYETAAGVYEYCADLFTYLYPSEALPARIYLPWAISSYNTQRNQSKCLQIAQRIRQDGRFDLRLEAIAGKAATKIGDGDLATQIFQAAEKKAQSSLLDARSSSSTEHPVSSTELAWFYCFVLPFPDKALSWANRTYETERNSSAAAVILAYALVMNKEMEWAKPLIKNYEHNQIAGLTLAQIQLTDSQKDLAIETLKTAIAKDPGSFAAERAKQILAQQGTKYIPPVDPNTVLTMLENVFGRTLVPAFTPPQKIISAQLNIQGNEFPPEGVPKRTYGERSSGTVALINNSAEPLVISDDALFQGNIRIDAEISGDLDRKIPNLVSVKIRTALLIEPGRSILIPVRLITGELRETLLKYPQASLDIEFTLYLDSVATDEGKITNRLTYIKPTRVRIKRPGVELTVQYLKRRLDLISKSNSGQKIKTAQLFTSLLREQQAMLNKPLYRILYADWMEPLLKSALSELLRNPADGQWEVKVHTLAEMLSLTLDYKLTSAVANNLYNSNWPVRMMAIYLLSKNPDSNFDKVLDWTAENDSSKPVRDMATAILGR